MGKDSKENIEPKKVHQCCGSIEPKKYLRLGYQPNPRIKKSKEKEVEKSIANLNEKSVAEALVWLFKPEGKTTKCCGEGGPNCCGCGDD